MARFFWLCVRCQRVIFFGFEIKIYMYIHITNIHKKKRFFFFWEHATKKKINCHFEMPKIRRPCKRKRSSRAVGVDVALDLFVESLF